MVVRKNQVIGCKTLPLRQHRRYSSIVIPCIPFYIFLLFCCCHNDQKHISFLLLFPTILVHGWMIQQKQQQPTTTTTRIHFVVPVVIQRYTHKQSHSIRPSCPTQLDFSFMDDSPTHRQHQPFSSSRSRRRISSSASSTSSSSTTTQLFFAKRRKQISSSNNNNSNNNGSDDNNNLDRWYGEVDTSKSPDDIFWEEMERQRLIENNGNSLLDNGSNPMESLLSSTSSSSMMTGSSTSSSMNALYGGGGVNNLGDGGYPSAYSSMMQTQQQAYSSNSFFSSSGAGGGSGGGSISSSSSLFKSNSKLKPSVQQHLRSIDATLSEYEHHMVPDNWLDDDLFEYMMSKLDEEEFDDNEFYAGVPSLDEQIDEWEQEDIKGENLEDDEEEDDDDDDEEEDADYEYYYDDDDENDNTNGVGTATVVGGREDDDDDNAWMQSDEPWDHWGEDNKQQQQRSTNKVYDPDDDDRVKLDVEKIKSGPAAKYLYTSHYKTKVNDDNDDSDTDTDDDDDDDEENDSLRCEEEEYNRRLLTIRMTSQRLLRAKDNMKAKLFFSRPPDAMEGYDRLWVSAIDNVCFKNLMGTFRNYGIEFADNFGDWEDEDSELHNDDDRMAGGGGSNGSRGSTNEYDMNSYTIEELASYKARLVYNITGLPCIASRTSWEIEPVPDWSRFPEVGVGMVPLPATAAATGVGGQKQQPSSSISTNPRVVSGYRFNDVGMHVDYISDALRPISEPNRVTRFKTCLCYYDGTVEVYDYGTCDVDLYFCHSLRTFIPVAQAINEMMKTLELTFGLEYQKWLRTRIDETNAVGGFSIGGSSSDDGVVVGRDGQLVYPFGAASMKLRDRVLKEGKVLPNDIIDVSAFMDSMVDVNLMDECASELANRFMNQKPTKILTVATTGLVIALPMAKYLQVPVVYARKERNVVMADTYIAGYSSKTVGKNRELLVSKTHLHSDDRVLIIDDFLSSGSSQEALLRIVAESNAISVGVGVLLEKVYDSGRQSLSGFDIPIHSLCRITSVQGGVIQLYEEEGFDKMAIMTQKQQQQQVQQQEEVEDETKTTTTTTTTKIPKMKNNKKRKQ